MNNIVKGVVLAFLILLLLVLVFNLFSPPRPIESNESTYVQQVDALAAHTLPPLPAGSSFLDQIDQENYPPTPAPDQPPLLRWDFSGDEVYPYDFSQKVIMTHYMEGMPRHEEGTVSQNTSGAKGKLSLKSQGGGTARLVLEDLTMTMKFNTPDSDEPKITESQAPPMVVQGVKEDGSMEICNSSQEMLFKTLFPLPTRPLHVGESVSVPGQLPFNAMGSLLYVKGDFNIMLTGYVKLGEKTCAKLVTDIDISQLDVPEEMEGNYACQLTGKSVFFFDVQNRHFISGKVAMMMSMRTEARTPKMSFPGQEKEEDAIPETMKMAMDSDNLIAVDYLEIE